jgi:hypothetical protein
VRPGAHVREVRKAWRTVPSESRGALLIAALKGQPAEADAETWKKAIDWARLYPARSVPATLSAAALLIVAFAYPDMWGEFSWVIIAYASLLLAAMIAINYLTFRIRRSPPPANRLVQPTDAETSLEP